jgi:hypothetical protein
VIPVLVVVLFVSAISTSLGSKETAPGKIKETNECNCQAGQICVDGTCLDASEVETAQEEDVEEQVQEESASLISSKPSKSLCIKGYIFNDCDDKPLQDWPIILKDANYAEIARTTSNQKGYYQFCDLAPGYYSVSPQEGNLGLPTFIDVDLVDVDVEDAYFSNPKVMGKDVATLEPDFFEQVLSGLGIPYSDFAYNALVHWSTKENTRAYWNPLATTHRITDKSCTFNTANVQNYISKGDGIDATVWTLSLGYYAPIRNMLSLKAFDEQAIINALNTWGTGKGPVREWKNTYPQSNQITTTVGAEDCMSPGSPRVPGVIVTGHDGVDNSIGPKTTDSNGLVTFTGAPGDWEFYFSASGFYDDYMGGPITQSGEIGIVCLDRI